MGEQLPYVPRHANGEFKYGKPGYIPRHAMPEEDENAWIWL